VTSSERSKLDQVKEQVKQAAGLSIQSPKVSGSFGIAGAESDGKEQGTASLRQDVRLTWDAHGGDTLLCSK